MTHVSIDRQPDAVKQFFESLTLTAEGSVVELNGKPLARMLPAESVPNSVTPGATWTAEHNRRRCDLIDKKFAAGLTPAEELELANLTAEMRQFVNRVAPLPLDDVRRRHQELLEKASAADTGV